MTDVTNRRVLQLTEEISERYRELREDLHVTDSDIADLVDRRVPNTGALITPMELVLARLFAEAPKLEDASGNSVAGQAPALQCHIVLRPGVTLQGVLSQTPEGMLRMLTPTQIPDPTGGRNGARTVLAEQFFHVSDVVAVAIERPVTASPGSRIHTTS